MYKFKTNIRIVDENPTVTSREGEIEWYLDFEVKPEGLTDFIIHVPKQVIEFPQGQGLCINKVHKQYLGILEQNTLQIKPCILVLKNDGSMVLEF